MGIEGKFLGAYVQDLAKYMGNTYVNTDRLLGYKQTYGVNTYWVDNNGSATWANAKSQTPLSGAACCTLATANANAAPGDLVVMRDGTYTTSIFPSDTGTGSGTGRIIYQAYPGETPILTGSIEGITLENREWIKVDGITVVDTDYYMMWLVDDSNYNEIVNCKFYQTSLGANVQCHISRGSEPTPNGPSLYNWVHRCEFHDVSTAVDCSDGIGLFCIGTATTGDQDSNCNTLEDNHFYHSGHHTLQINTKYNVIRNNYLHNEGFRPYPVGGCDGVGEGVYDCDDADYYPGNNKYGHRNVELAKADNTKMYNLIEGNRIGYASANPTNDGADGITLAMSGVIIRYNDIWGGDGPAIFWKNGDDASYNYVYNNTLYDNGRWDGDYDASPDDNICLSPLQITAGSTGSNFRNNLLYGNVSESGEVVLNGDGADISQIGPVNNWGFATDAPEWTSSGDPKFVSTPAYSDAVITEGKTVPNLNLASDSTAIDGGTYLTQSNGASDGDETPSTTLVVDDALYFQAGSAAATTPIGAPMSNIAGDWIAIGTVSNVAQIIDINYATNTITLSEAKTWVDNANVWLYKRSDGTRVLYGSAPDYGAHESNY
jgi:hypothetical protein